MIQRLTNDGHIYTRAPQAQPNRDLGAYQNCLPRNAPNMNHVSTMASTSRQVMHGGPFPIEIIDMMGIKPFYIATCTRRGSERAPLHRDTQAHKPMQPINI